MRRNSALGYPLVFLAFPLPFHPPLLTPKPSDRSRNILVSENFPTGRKVADEAAEKIPLLLDRQLKIVVVANERPAYSLLMRRACAHDVLKLSLTGVENPHPHPLTSAY